MKVTIHACERLLERVFNIKKPTLRQKYDAMTLLERETENIISQPFKFKQKLTSFEGFYGVFKEQTLITIIQEG